MMKFKIRFHNLTLKKNVIVEDSIGFQTIRFKYQMILSRLGYRQARLYRITSKVRRLVFYPKDLFNSYDEMLARCQLQHWDMVGFKNGTDHKPKMVGSSFVVVDIVELKQKYLHKKPK